MEQVNKKIETSPEPADLPALVAQPKLEYSKRRTFWNKCWKFFSGEKLLDSCPNGGGIILLRSFLITTIVYAIAIAIKELITPGKMWEPNLKEFQKLILDTLPWFGAIFAASYAALYTRFASQWSYLAGLYNQIMATQAQAPPNNEKSEKVFHMWKAGFIEDAQELHLATKPMYASIIKSMLESKEVREYFIKYTPGGESRLVKLEEAIEFAIQKENSKYLR